MRSLGSVETETAAAYDPFADWYNDYMSPAVSGEYIERLHGVLGGLLGPGSGTCLDVCCGTGAHAAVLEQLGWTPIGVDLSRGQLRHARDRLPVAAADATRLPIADGSVSAVSCVLASTDMPDYPGAVREIARVLRPGGVFAHVGLHPCYVGSFADRTDPERITIDQRYGDRSRSFDSWNATGVRSRVGAWHVPLSDLLNAFTVAGLHLVRTTESGAADIPDMFGIRAVKAGKPPSA